MMSGTGHQGKRPMPCRFYSSGNCVYGENCRNLHTNPPPPQSMGPSNHYQNGPHHMDNTVLEEMGGPGGPPMGGSGGGDQYFNTAFNQAPGNSRNQMNDFPPFRRGRPIRNNIEQLSQSAKPFVPSQGPGHMEQSLANDFAALNLASSMVKNVQGPAGNDFPPLPSNNMPHSASTPSFAALSTMFTQPPPTSTPVSHVINNGPTLTFPSPSHSPGISPSGSPHMFRRNPNSNLMSQHRQASIPQKQSAPIHQETVGGTVYFYNPDEFNPQSEGIPSPNFTMFHSTPFFIRHMKFKGVSKFSKGGKGPPSFYMADELKTVILNRQALSYASYNPSINPDVPQEVDNYDNLVQLERSVNPNIPTKSILGYHSTCYKATHKKDGSLYCLRRIQNFRLNPSLNAKLMTLVDAWNKVYHPNIVQLKEAFTTKAFGDNSVVVVYDYLPGAETLMSQKFTGNIQPLNGFTSDYGNNSRNFSTQGARSGTGDGGLSSSNQGMTETEIWSYIVQMCSALRCVHTSGLAARTMEPTKILVFGKGRLRVNCVGAMDILALPTIDQQNLQTYIQHWQQEDLTGFGRIVLGLACNSALAVQSQNFTHAMEIVSRNYSPDLKNLIAYLFETRKPRSVNDLMPMIGARFFTQLDHSQLRGDMLLDQLSKEVENGRLCRLMMKLCCILERAEFNMDLAWSETGDRYMLKLFRDYVFHAVDENGAPWMDMSHIIHCLNKLDAGSPEKVMLTSRDESSIFIVSFADLKRQFSQAFHELATAGQSMGFS